MKKLLFLLFLLLGLVGCSTTPQKKLTPEQEWQKHLEFLRYLDTHGRK